MRTNGVKNPFLRINLNKQVESEEMHRASKSMIT